MIKSKVSCRINLVSHSQTMLSAPFYMMTSSLEKGAKVWSGYARLGLTHVTWLGFTMYATFPQSGTQQRKNSEEQPIASSVTCQHVAEHW